MKILQLPPEGRDPDFVIGPKDAPYLQRWWLIPRNRWFNVYLHHILHSDDDRALHDHMYFNVSVLLRGRYVEHMIRQGGVGHAVERRMMCGVSLPEQGISVGVPVKRTLT